MYLIGRDGVGNSFLQEFVFPAKSLYQFHFTSLRCVPLLCAAMHSFYFCCRRCAGIISNLRVTFDMRVNNVIIKVTTTGICSTTKGKQASNQRNKQLLTISTRRRAAIIIVGAAVPSNISRITDALIVVNCINTATYIEVTDLPSEHKQSWLFYRLSVRYYSCYIVVRAVRFFN